MPATLPASLLIPVPIPARSQAPDPPGPDVRTGPGDGLDHPPRRAKPWSEMTNEEAARHIVVCWKLRYFDQMFDDEDDDE